ncbi:MAG: trigger factor [Vicinamibacterales bacterium]
MKVEFADVSETRKRLTIEIPSEEVDAGIDRLVGRLGRSAKVAGFRPGKVPPRVVWQRFKDEILNDVAHDLVPQALDAALRERDLEPVDTPDVRDVVVEQGAPLTFVATFDTVPSFDPGEYRGVALRKPSAAVEDAAVDETLERLRQRAARFEPVEGRPLAADDWATVDLERRVAGGDPPAEAETHENVTIDLGAEANPPGFSEQLIGLEAGAHTAFTVHYPDAHPVKDLAGRSVEYGVTLKAIKQRVVPALDDEFAKDLGSFDSLAALRDRVRQDLEHEAAHEADRAIRGDLLADLARRVPFAVPDALIEQELDRRVEEFARRLVEQQVDLRKAGIDWNEFRSAQREAATESVKAMVVLDEIARREPVVVGDEDVAAEIGRFAGRSGRTSEAVRAQLEKDNGVTRLRGGLRREKTVELLLANAAITMA